VGVGTSQDSDVSITKIGVPLETRIQWRCLRCDDLEAVRVDLTLNSTSVRITLFETGSDDFIVYAFGDGT
jgi:hypothetical protein